MLMKNFLSLAQDCSDTVSSDFVKEHVFTELTLL